MRFSLIDLELVNLKLLN